MTSKKSKDFLNRMVKAPAKAPIPAVRKPKAFSALPTAFLTPLRPFFTVLKTFCVLFTAEMTIFNLPKLPIVFHFTIHFF